ncbi:MAG: hypothetical protein JHC84_12510 [Solirubrobacteraceae bacterium]|nr:hypothetical protein [Solirubrobacteraceae bacterium]
MTRAGAALVAAVALVGCGGAAAGPPQLPKEQGEKLAEASMAVTGACARGPLTPEQERALQPRVELLVEATKSSPDSLFEYPQEDQNPLLTTPALELQAVIGALGGVGPQPVCNQRLADLGDRGLVEAGQESLLRDMPSTRG